MVANLSLKQPWHTKYCHLKFSHSDLSANYATHYMLILTKNYAVKTGQPQKQLTIDNNDAQLLIETANLQKLYRCVNKYYNCYFYQLLKIKFLMEPALFYKKRIDELQLQLKKLQQKKSAFGWLRFGSIAAIIAAFYFLWSLGAWYVMLASILLLIIFIRLLYADLKNKAAIGHVSHLVSINKDELKFLAGNYQSFPGGNEHIPEDHLYANDLDIFGKASVFQYINRATSEMGSSQLADYLQFPAEINLIVQRQIAVKELSKKIEWIQELQAKGREKQITFSTKTRLENWIAAVSYTHLTLPTKRIV